MPIIHWCLGPGQEPDDDYRSIVKGMILGSVIKYYYLLGLPRTEIDPSEVPTTLFTSESGKEIRFDTSFEPDSISPVSWRGAGTITPSDGHYAFLFLLYLKYKMSDTIVLDFANEQGDELAFTRLGHWRDMLVSMGFDYATVLKDAVTLSLALEPIEIPDSVDIDNVYF